MKLTQTLLEWTLTSALLILVITAMRVLLGKWVSAGLRYALWAVVLARLLVPVQLFTSPIAGAWAVTEIRTEKNVIEVPSAPAVDGLASDEVSGSAPAFPNPPDVPEPPAATDLTKLPAVLGWVWLGGSAVTALVLLASNLQFNRKLRRVRVPLEGADCLLPVYVSNSLPSPCLFGLARPTVYVTPDVAADPDMLPHVLAHEYTHYRHGDHVWNLLRSVALAVHWWNPLVWLAALLSRRDCELACDEGALHLLGDGTRIAYGRTLLALLAEKPRAVDLLTWATTMTGGQKSVFERVTRIARAPKRWLWAGVAAVLVAVLACACAFGQAEEQTPDTPDGLTAELSFSLEKGDGSGSALITGLEDAYVSWSSDSSPSEGWLYFAGNPAFFSHRLAGKSVEGSALWTDETRTAVAVVIVVDDPRVVSGTVSGFSIQFTVELENGDILKQVFESEVDGETLELTSQEMADAARVFARLLTEAEDYYLDHLPAPAPKEEPLPFDAPMELWFGSGAGGWRTILTLQSDGSFEGDYSDADMGDSGDSYPNGTQYICRFHGQFGNITQKTGTSWSMTLDELVIDTGRPIGEKWIEDSVRYISSSPYGMDGKDSKPLEPSAQFILYTPEAAGYAPDSELYGMADESSKLYEFWTWWPNRHAFSAEQSTLDCYALRSVETGYGFFDLHSWGIE